MCGIVGVIGNKRATEILLNGLEKLEYRGYDSAGIFVSDQEGTQHCVKAQGRIADLRAEVSAQVQGSLGIGHTRWATHGQPSWQNAHPHQSQAGRFTLVHNGVLENFEELKQNFLPTYPFQSETDTEVIVALVEYFSNQGLETKAAFQATLAELKGSYALGLVDQETPELLYVAKNKSPLLIGLGEGFNLIASDALAMIKETDQLMEIHDGELVLLRADGYQIENAAGIVTDRQAFTAQIDADDIEKGTYPYYMLKEIDEQPTVMRRILQAYTDEAGKMQIDEQLLSHLAESDRLYIVACGTSYHAGWVGKTLIESLSHIPVEVHLASEFSYHMPLLSERPFFIFLSQSGETADSRQVLVQTNALNYPALTITNVAGSTLSREADYTLLLYAGPEIAVASTKAYTAQVAVLAALAKALGEKRQQEVAKNFDLQHELSLVATGMESLINQKEVIEQLVSDYLTLARNAFYIGRGNDYFVAMEAALKLKEISYIQAEGFAAGELKHGTIALIEAGTPVFGLITDEKTAGHTRGNLKEVESRGAQTCVIALEPFSRPNDQLILPTCHPLLTALMTVVPTQLIAYFATLQRGYDVDKPRNLAKSVTVE